MTKDSKSMFLGLLISMFIGFTLGMVLWLAGKGDASALWLTVGFGLCYLRIRWLRNLNKSKSDTKLKQII